MTLGAGADRKADWEPTKIERISEVCGKCEAPNEKRIWEDRSKGRLVEGANCDGSLSRIHDYLRYLARIYGVRLLVFQ